MPSDRENNLAQLREFDTPTVSNALSRVTGGAPQNFTRQPLLCAFPALPPMVGFARTATMRGARPCPLSREAEIEHELEYWSYVEAGPGPSISVIQDLDGPDVGYASIWGEVNASLHLGLGCAGTITDGGIRDLDSIPEGFQMLARQVTPFGSWSHFLDFGCDVSVFGMFVRSGDLIHADRHGAVVIAPDLVPAVVEAAKLVMRREKPLIDAGRKRGLTVADIRAAHAARAHIV